ncbi:MAG: hypothetical protein JO043_06915 [Candidatus Eremiobacteraeota bacterium]|nr:hypothetical protein [Candidatus Eremiobacteraeota bacterium]
MRLLKVAAPLACAALIGVGAYAVTSQASSASVSRPVVHSMRTVHHMGRIVAGPFASARLNDEFYHRPVVRILPQGTVISHDVTCTPKAYTYASDNTTGDLDQFCEDTPNTLVKTLTGAAGWGLAVQPGKKQLAAGKTGGTISVYKNATSLTTPYAVLTLSGASSGDNAYGICWDDVGGIYATNWPSNVINYFAPPLKTGETPTSITTTTVTEDYYVACDFDKSETGNKGYLMVYGLNGSTGDSDVAQVTLPSGPDTVVQTLGNINQGTGFPGGLTINKKDELLANNQYGTLYDLGKKEPWNAKITHSCTWGFNPNDFTNISWDNTLKEVWASNINFGGTHTVTYLQSVAYPLPTSGACVTPGESGGPTTAISGESSYLGVAVYKNLGE